MADIQCIECKQALNKVKWNINVYMLICDNWECVLYHQPQTTVRSDNPWSNSIKISPKTKPQESHVIDQIFGKL